MVELIHHFWPSISLWQMVLATFVIYVLIILLFGIFYYFLFFRKNDRFLPAPRITEWQAKRKIAEIETEILNVAREIESMQEVRDAVASGVLKGTVGTLPSGHEVSINTNTITNGLNISQSQERLFLKVTDANRNVLCNIFGPQDEKLSDDYFIEWLDKSLSKWHNKQDSLNRRLEEVKKYPAKSLGFLDFLYFSAITQTTVGYGDILPNSTGIRLLIVMQILIGLGLLVVILNLVLAV